MNGETKTGCICESTIVIVAMVVYMQLVVAVDGDEREVGVATTVWSGGG